MKQIPKILTKTKLMRGYQCLKSIYLTAHKIVPDPQVTPELQALFDQGKVVGIGARKRYPKGVLVDTLPWEFVQSLKKTRELLQNGTDVIFEAAFEYKGCFSRADIITFSKETKRWTIFEVKSTTKVKDENLDDVGLQAWIMANSGLPIEQINIMHINSECKFPDLSNLFTTVDVTEKVRADYTKIAPKLTSIFSTLKSDKEPDTDIGPHCSSPNNCPFMSHCWEKKNIPPISVLNLPKPYETRWELYNQGIMNLDDARIENLAPLQQRVINAFKTKERFIDKDGLKKAISDWKFPLFFLDFETINPAIPRYDDTRPYQQVPFQFSVHIWQTPESAITHKEYLHTDKSDPRPSLIPALLDACSSSGTIVAYYSSFESQRIKELADFSEEYRERLESLLPRIADPLPIIRDFVYDNEFEGLFGLKTVAPAILGEASSYDDLLVNNGTAAQRAFEVLIDSKTDPAKRQELIDASIEYCKKDTMVMVDLVKWMIEKYELHN